MKKQFAVCSLQFAIFFFCYFPAAKCQPSTANSVVDSLLSLLKKDKADTNKINHLNLLSRQYIDIGSYDKALVEANRALILSDSLPNGIGKGGSSSAFNNIGLLYTEQGDYPKALDNYFKALNISEGMKDKYRMGVQFGNIGNAYTVCEDYQKALSYYMKAMKIGEELGDRNRIAIQLSNIGNIYYYLNDCTRALEYYFKALKMGQELGNLRIIASINGNIANVYKEQADQIVASNNVSDSLYDNALKYYFKALKLAEQLESKNGITIQLGNIGLLYTQKKNFTEAEKYLLGSLAMAEDINSMDDVKVGHLNLSNLYEKTGKFEKAFNHYKLFCSAKDSLFNEGKSKEITRKELNYEFEKKEAAAKAEQDIQTAVAEADKKKQQIVLWSVVSCLLLVVVFASFIFRALRTTRKQKLLIEEQKKVVEEKQKEILDSIHYAKRIQTALLPTEKYIDKTLKRLNNSK